MSGHPDIDPERWVEEHGDILYRYALGRLRDPVVAQDLVQETFLAAIRAQERFSGRSTERTWLTGILKHKVIDYFRKSSRERYLEDAKFPDTKIEELFETHGTWKQGQPDWQINPRNVAEQKEFWIKLEECLSGLPKRLREVFVLRELEFREADDVCKKLDITSSNLWVMLYRARSKLRVCLEENWVKATSAKAE